MALLNQVVKNAFKVFIKYRPAHTSKDSLTTEVNQLL